MTRWYVVFTQPAAEERALAHLLRQDYAAYLPRCRRERRHARRLETVVRPLFPRYLFVALDMMSHRWRPILSTFGVTDLVRRGDLPAPVPDGLVEALRERETAGVPEDPAAWRPRPGEAVRVTSGAFADTVGSLFRIAERDRVQVLLNLLGRDVLATVPLGHLAAV